MTKPQNTLHLGGGLDLDADDFAGSSCALLGQRGSGKRLALDTPLATPFGWTTMGDVQAGDLLFDDQGQVCSITSISPVVMGDARLINFSDGSTIVADAEHLWLTWTKGARASETSKIIKDKISAAKDYSKATSDWVAARPQCRQQASNLPAVRTTAEIEATLTDRGETNHSIRNALPLVLPPADLPLHPYVLGVWLGDGTRGQGTFTSADPEIGARIEDLGYEVFERPSQRVGDTGSFRVGGLRVALKTLGVVRDKRIPTSYLRGSVEQRLELLKGLLDTDGGWSGGNVELALSDEGLARDAYELIVSLGMRVSWSERIPSNRGKAGRTSFRMRFRPLMQVFALPRKAARHTPPPGRRTSHRYITGVEPVPSVPMRCISVDSPSRLYLAGRQMVPTHNTYTARVLVEELTKAQVQTVVVDPMGVFWGLRSSADGTQPGLPIPVFGGTHGDAPLEPTAGHLMADLVVDEGLSMILDLSGFSSRTNERTFAGAFFDRLYRRNRDLVHVVIDEADLFAPQRPRGQDAPLLATMENLIRRGRNKGIGATLATQRPAVLHKDVLSQVDVLAMLRVTGPQDRDAIREWVRGQGDENEWAGIAPSLPTLASGESWWWVPQNGLLKRVQIRTADTFDSSPTRKRGQASRAPKTTADVDLDAISSRIADTIERGKANDPAALRREVTDLRRRLEEATRTPVTVPTAPAPAVAAQPSVPDAVMERLEAALEAARHESDRAAAVAQALLAAVGEATDTAGRLHAAADAVVAGVAETRSALAGPVTSPTVEPVPTPRSVRRPTHASPSPAPVPAGQEPTSPADAAHGATPVSPARQRLLDALATLAAIGVPEVQKTQLALWAGASPKSSGYTNNLGALRSAGLIDYPTAGHVALTDAGRSVAHAQDSPTDTASLHRRVRDLLAPARWRVLEPLLGVYPDSISKDDLAVAAGTSATSSGYTNNLGALRSLGFLDYPSPRQVQACAVLFLPDRVAA